MVDRILVAGFGGDCPRLVIQLGDFRLDAIVMLANVRVGHPPLSVGTLLSDVPPMTGPGVPLPVQSFRVLVVVFAPVVLPGAAFLVIRAIAFPHHFRVDRHSIELGTDRALFVRRESWRQVPIFTGLAGKKIPGTV